MIVSSLVALVIAAAGLVAALLIERDREPTSGLSANSRSETAAADEPEVEIGITQPTLDEPVTESNDESAGRADTTERRESSSTVGTSPPGLFTERSELYGRYVAVLWSTVTSVPLSNEDREVIRGQLVDSQGRFGDGVFAVDSRDYGSLRDGTAAVIYDGGFRSALEAKRWCRDAGFAGLYDCFGVVLSDDFGPDDRGEYIRVYD